MEEKGQAQFTVVGKCMRNAFEGGTLYGFLFETAAGSNIPDIICWATHEELAFSWLITRRTTLDGSLYCNTETRKEISIWFYSTYKTYFYRVEEDGKKTILAGKPMTSEEN